VAAAGGSRRPSKQKLVTLHITIRVRWEVSSGRTGKKLSEEEKQQRATTMVL
jgi:hypothetical protein